MSNTYKTVIFHGLYFLLCGILFCNARNIFFYLCPHTPAGFTATVVSRCDPLRHVAYHLLYFAITLFNICLYLHIYYYVTNIHSPAAFSLILWGSVSFRLTSLVLWRKKNLQVTDSVRYLQVFLVKARMEKKPVYWNIVKKCYFDQCSECCIQW
jgi:hypothetical protein